MFQVERRDIIIKYLEEHESASVEELAEKLNVAPMTIRRDLKYLEDNNILTRTFGGAVLRSKLTTEIPYRHKSIVHKDEKDRIAEAAASMVKDGQIVLLDSGTTTMEIAKKLCNKKNLRIVTTDVMIAGYLSSYTEFDILCTGGHVQNNTGTCIGLKASDFLKEINGDISFIGCSSLDIEKGVTTPTFDKADVKKQMIKSSAVSVLVTDSSKFGRISFTNVCHLDEVSLIITDSKIDEKVLEKLRGKKINIKTV